MPYWVNNKFASDSNHPIFVARSDTSITATPNYGIMGDKVYNAVWNDIADWIEVPNETILEPGKCYVFDGKNYVFSKKYMDEGIIGIHSDTAGICMGHKGKQKELRVSVAGFVLAYVDKVYSPGTPLTCGENGILTEMKREDTIQYPEKLIATFWKDEPEKNWPKDHENAVTVNGRKWVKIR